MKRDQLSKQGLRLARFAWIAALIGFNAQAQSFPEQPIRLLVPFAAGGSTDLAGRIMAVEMGRLLGQSIVVENKPGAGGRIAADALLQAKPDGYTLLLAGTSSYVLLKGTPPALPYDPATAFMPIAIFAKTQLAIAASNALGAQNLKAALDLIRASPNKVAYGSAGIGTSTHITWEFIFKQLGLQAIHVPYKGSGPVVPDLIAGRLSLMIEAVGVVAPYVARNEMKALAVLNPQRAKLLPETPTLTEAGFAELAKYDLTTWFGIAARASTSMSVAEKVNYATNKAVQNPQVAQSLEKLGVDPQTMSLSEAKRFVDVQFNMWVPVMLGLKLE